MSLVSLGLSSLSQQDEWRGIGGLQTESHVEQDEGVNVKLRHASYIDADPDSNKNGLRDEKTRRAKKPGKVFRLERESIVTERRGEMSMRPVKT